MELRPRERVVLVDGRAADLGGRAFDLLLTLVEHRDRVVTRRELMDAVWPGVVVEEGNLSVQIAALRRVLGPAVITTVARRGYRFALPSPAATPLDDPAPPHRYPGNVAAPAARLIGRDVELQTLSALVSSHALVTVVGAAGVGKTRLAQAAAHRFARDDVPDGVQEFDAVWWIDLCFLAEASLLAGAVAYALDIGLPGRNPPVQELATALYGRRWLLVLDNCEHWADDTAALCRQVLEFAPSVRLLATSQVPLRVPGEHLLRLRPLALPSDSQTPLGAPCAAVQLLEERVSALDARFEVGERNHLAVLELCRHLDGLPLAIELAAARIPLLGVQGVLDRLGQRFLLLATSSARGAPRRYDLREAIAWSLDQLDEVDKVVFRRLGVFGGSFTMDAAQRVVGADGLDEWPVLETLGRLVDRSLVQADGMADGQTYGAEVPRFRLLESMRALALEQLHETGEAPDCRRRHAEHFVGWLESLADALYGGTLTEEAFVRLRLIEVDNLRGALEATTGSQGDAGLAWRLMTAAAPMVHLLPFQAQAARWWAALAQADATCARRAAQARYVWIQWGQSVWWESQRWPAEPVSSPLDALNDTRRQAHALCLQALKAVSAGDLAAAGAALHDAGTLQSPDWPAWLCARRVLFGAVVDREAGRPIDTQALEAALAALRRAGEGEGRWSFRIRCVAALEGLFEGRAQESVGRLAALVESGRLCGLESSGMSTALTSLMLALLATDRLDEARTAARQSVQHLVHSGLWPRLGSCLALVAARCGRTEGAARLLGVVDDNVNRNGLRRTRVIEQAHRQAIAIVADSHGRAQLEAWMAEGAALDGAAFARLALASVCASAS